jgi:RHS repeat-associated protein
MHKDEKHAEGIRGGTLAGQRSVSAQAPSGGQNEAETSGLLPSITLPKGGGAIRGIGEKFSANPVTGTGSLSVPIATSPGRAGFGPALVLAYNSGAGNGPFGLGFHLSVPNITRKTDKGLPRYDDIQDSDTFILSGAEDLVPACRDDGAWSRDTFTDGDETVARYRPRVEGLFVRIERRRNTHSSDSYWVITTKDNVRNIYGKSSDARIVDPEHPSCIFSWLLEETRDDRGNVVRYIYKAEDDANVDPRNTSEFKRFDTRTDGTRVFRATAQRYLKRIQYGNRTPVARTEPAPSSSAEWLFEVVFDYGEHDDDAPSVNESRPWLCRPDAFSTYRAGFEIRTYRLCRRVLMFHRMTELGSTPCLVRSTDYTYAENPILTQLTAVTHVGYVRDPATLAYRRKNYPPLELGYASVQLHTAVHTLDQDTTADLPAGVQDPIYQWVDLDGEGLPGVLSQQDTALFYKRNNGGGKLAPARVLTRQPAITNLAAGGQQILDVDGDGRKELVVIGPPASGYHERTEDDGWGPFHVFAAQALVNFQDPNLRFIDLSGDGHEDILIAHDDVFVWFPSLAKGGFARPITFHKPRDEDKGAAIVFADGTQSIFLADMSGDGLTDIVRIRNGSVCYWPNLGYGRFSSKVTMGGHCLFDNPDKFDPARIRLVDVDGSGTTDILYIHRDGVRIYANQAGNSLAPPVTLPGLPDHSNLSSIAALDLLGSGTACLVWSSPLPGTRYAPIRYIDLLGSTKPHLLTLVKNNLGLETRLQYAPSTKFYLADRAAGRPWITRLPFPVQVLERVESYDHISRARFVSTYRYHHGCFDGVEREFRGFGMVEQWDAEAFEDYVVGVPRGDGSQELTPETQPPVNTRTWYHTGAFLNRERILHQYRQEYYRREQHLPEPILPPGMNADELRECMRALKGLPLRQEIYSFDGSLEEQHPYTVVENNFEIRWLQPQGKQRHGVFFPVGRESISLNYERNPADPRISHTLDLELDEYGSSRASCSVVYGRKVADLSLPAEVTRDQQRRYITYNETDYTPDIVQGAPAEAYRLRVPYESRSYEITGISPAAGLFQFDEIKAKVASSASIDYEVVADDVTPQKRLLSHSRALFLDNTLNPLPLGQWDSLGLGYQSYRLAFTPGVVGTHYAGNASDADFAAAGYVHFDGDVNWWIPSGVAIYPADSGAHFHRPNGSKDPLGVETIATLDQYDLLVEKVEVIQAAWNVVTAINDYRVLGPVQMTDPNKNRSAVEHDELGMVVKTAIMGKAGSADGDTLADPTTRMEYELFNWIGNRKPNYVHSFAREKHGAANPRWQESYAYSNGSGGVTLVKAQAHPGKAFKVDPDGNKVEVDADPRWVGNGRTILNNKGKPVKQYEPYFSTTHEYEDEKVLRETGITPVLYYDPVGRNTRTLFPNGTFVRVEFNPWMQKVFDANDTVKESQWYIDRGSPDSGLEPEPLTNPERRAAWLATKHADTPGTIHFDSLGRPVYVISDYGGGKTAAVRSENDLTGRLSKMFDQEQREVASGFVGMAGIPIVGESAEKGQRWTFPDVLGALVKTWDEHGRQFRAEYDNLHRLVSTFVQDAGQPEITFNYVIYGERLANAEQLNMLGTTHQIFDQAGMVRIPELDFKGNPKSVERILARDYKDNLDWNTLAAQPDYAAIQAVADPVLEIDEIFTASSQYDALNRPTQVVLPDGTVLVPSYNESNFLASLRAQIRGQGSFIEFLKDQDYDARGRRQFARYGNDVFARYFYDPNTFRLINLLTYRAGANPQAQGMQNLQYTYDPVGNITQIRDDAQQTHYFHNAVVKPESLYEYDAIYQLIRATGRELAGAGNDTVTTNIDLDFIPQLPHANDAHAVRTYTEEYEYDLLGNIKVLKHRFKAQPGIGSGWTRYYRYAFEDDLANRTNRLITNSLPGDPDASPSRVTYDYDAYGNMIRMPHLAALDWNSMDQLRQVDLGGGGTAHYVYGLDGQRLRKVIERNGNLKLEWIFLGAVMIFRRRRRDTNELRMERWTVHLSDNTGHIAQIDTKSRDDDNLDPANSLNTALIRYQYGNHLGSAVLETNEEGLVISYEEYHPYGTSAYRSAKPGFEPSLKRYRFSGKERDEESGLYYFGARYYLPWLGRWASTDPAGFVSGANLYRFCTNNPIMFYDPNGMQEEPRRVHYSLRDLGLSGVTDPAVVSGRLRELGFDFTGFDTAGNPVAPDSAGRGVGLVKRTREGWDAGRLLRRPGEGEGGGTAETAPLAEPPPSTQVSSPPEAQPPSSAPPEPEISSEPPPNGTDLAPVPDATRSVLQEAARPSSVTGARPRGTLHLWSGSQGKDAARAAIRSSGGGWMMGDIGGAPTPEHAAGEVEFNRARAGAPGGQLTQAEFERIWGPRSASVVGRGAFAGHPVEAHGTPAPTSIQARYEWPARAVGGGLGGGLFFGTGMFTAISGAQDPNPAVAVPLVLGGVAEATSGIIYGAGAILGSAESMAIGVAGGTFFGGATAAIGFGVASARSFERGDTAGGIVNALGAVGGVLLIASLFTPVGWVGLAGVGLVALAAGFNLGRWLRD